MRRALVTLALVLALALPGCFSSEVQPGPPAADGAPLAPRVTLEAVQFDTTAGTFVAVLYPEDAPETVAFMKELVTQGYYDGREFNRVIPGFVIQEVDKAGGATDQPKRIPLEAGKRSTFSAGALGIARDSDPDSGGSEFFVMDFAASHLYGNYTVWGQVVTGLDVVHKIARVRTLTMPAPPALPSPAPAAPWPFMDRMAVDAVKITRATLTTVELGTDALSLLPRQVAPTVRSADGYRYTLEYPADLTAVPLEAAKAALPHLASMTWYSWARGEGATPHDPAALSVRVRGPVAEETHTLEADPADPGILRWWWQPPAPGTYNVTLMKGPKELAWADVAAP